MTIKRQANPLDVLRRVDEMPLVYQDEFCDCRNVCYFSYIINCFDAEGKQWATCYCDGDGDMVESCEDLGYIAEDAPKDFNERLENYDWDALREAVQKDCEKRKAEWAKREEEWEAKNA